MLAVFLAHFLYYLLRQGLLLNPDLVDFTSLASQLSSCIPLFFIPSVGITGELLFKLAEDLNSGLHACIDSTLSMETSA